MKKIKMKLQMYMFFLFFYLMELPMFLWGIYNRRKKCILPGVCVFARLG